MNKTVSENCLENILVLKSQHTILDDVNKQRQKIIRLNPELNLLSLNKIAFYQNGIHFSKNFTFFCDIYIY